MSWNKEVQLLNLKVEPHALTINRNTCTSNNILYLPYILMCFEDHSEASTSIRIIVYGFFEVETFVCLELFFDILVFAKLDDPMV